MSQIIKGSGGILGSKPKTASFQQNKDSQISTSQITITEIISEGEIAKVRQIYIEGVPLFDANGNNTAFPKISYEIRKGTPTQDLTSNRTGSSVVKSVGIEIKNSNPPTIRGYINENVDKLIVTTRFALQIRNDQGVFGEICRYRISLKSGNGAFVNVLERDIGGLFSSPIEIQDEILVNNQNGAIDSFQLKVEKLSPDSTDTNLVRTMEWVATSEVVTDRIPYEKTSYIQFSFPSELYTNDVKREYELDGIIFDIPSNATVDPVDGGLIFNGPWNGTLYTPSTATTDGVWQMLGIITDDFYGAGSEIGVADINIADLYGISVYNNGYVSDGYGGLERRYLCSTRNSSRGKAKKILDDFCSNFNASYYSQAGQLRFWQDRPETIISELFTNSDVEGGNFIYGFSGSKSKSSVYTVMWNDPLNDYKQTPEPVRYKAGMDLVKSTDTQVVQFGNTRRSQAIRYGRTAIYDNWLNTKSINFLARTKGIYLTPGKLIEVSDNSIKRFNMAGLIKSATTTTVYLDTPVVVEPFKNYSLKVVLPNGVVEERNVISTPGETYELTVSTPFTIAPETESTWILKSHINDTEIYRIVNVTINKNFQVEISAIKYVAEKWDFIENNLSIVNNPTFTSKLPENLPTPTNLRTEQIIVGDLDSTINLYNTWDSPNSPFVKSYIVQTSRDGVNWSDTRDISSGLGFQLENVSDGLHQFRVASLGLNNTISDWVVSQVTEVYRSTTQMNLESPFAWEY
jgi:predicted phage tail protein